MVFLKTSGTHIEIGGWYVAIGGWYVATLHTDSGRVFQVIMLASGESPGKEDGCSLKPFAAAQRVRLPPGRGAAHQPEASLAWVAATLLVKRRQQIPKPGVEPRYTFAREPSVCMNRGQYRQDRQGRGSIDPAGV